MKENERFFECASNATELLRLVEEEPDVDVLLVIQKVMMSLGAGKNIFGFSRFFFTDTDYAYAWIIELEASIMPKAMIIKTSASGTKVIEVRPQPHDKFSMTCIYFKNIFPLMVCVARNTATNPSYRIVFIENPL